MYLTPERITRLQTRLSTIEAQITALENALTEAANPVQSYRLAGADGSTTTEYRSMHEIRNNLRILEAERESIHQQLKGYGVTTISVRR